jgi:hypothetical protein
MLKSFFAGILILLATIFGLHHTPVVTTSTPVEPVTEVLTVVNHVSADPITLVANTRFETDDQLIFRTPQAITIPGKRGAADGTVEVTVVADRTGSQYDIGAARLTLPGLAANPTLYQGVYAYTSGASPQASQVAAAVAGMPNISGMSSAGNTGNNSNTSVSSGSLNDPPNFANAAPSDPSLSPSQSVLTASVDATSYVTKDELTAQIEQATNALRSLIYQNQSVPNSLPASGGFTNNIALATDIDQLSGTTLNNVTVNGISGLTAADIPTDITASNYLPLSGGTLTGAFVNTATSSSSFAGALGIGTTSPSDVFAVNGPIYLANTTPSATTNRLYSSGGSLYWAGSLVGGGSVGNWSTDGTNAWRPGGNVGIGTTSPSQALSVQGNALFSGNITGANITATGTLAMGSLSNLNGGFLSFASSTVGNGTQTGGLTISGGATTTGNAYFAGTLIGNIVNLTTSVTHSNSGQYLNTIAIADNLTGSVSGLTTGFSSIVTTNGTGSVTASGHIIGAYGQVTHNGSGTVGEAIPLEGIGQNTGGGTITYMRLITSHMNSNNGTITNLSLFEPMMAGADNTGGTIGQLNAFDCSGVGTSGTVLSKYCVYNSQPDLPIFTQGFIGIGSGATSPDVPLSTGTVLNTIKIAAYDSGINSLFGMGVNAGALTIGANIAATGTPQMVLTIAGKLGIGTSTPYGRLEVWGPDSAATTSAFSVINNASTTVFSVYDNGNATYSGSIFQSSDQRLKTDVSSLDAYSSLAALEQLNPVSYTRIDQPGSATNLGFLAQQVQSIFPQLVSTSSPTELTPDGTLTLNYSGLIAPIVASIQAIAHVSGDIQTNLIAWLGSASNGIQDLFAENLHAQNELCVGSTCVTPAQFQAMVTAAGQTGAAPSTSGQGSSGASGASASSTPDTPPVITINGDNPAIIYVGDTYSDLGATVAGPAQDLNLGINVSVDGSATTTADEISIDTSTSSTHTITYFATDQSGEIGYATRSVVVEAATSTP